MNYYNQISKSYEYLHKKEQLNKLQIIKNNLKLDNNTLILDVGCGPCWSDEFFDNVIGVDPAFGLLSKGKSKNVVQGSAEKLPFKDNTFDIIICVTAVHHFDLDKAFSEMKRISKKNAQLAITILKKSSKKDEIITKIRRMFDVDKIIEEDKDLIYFVR